MSIKFNEVTWYSKQVAATLFIVVVSILTFYIVMKYQENVTMWEGVKEPRSGVTITNRPLNTVDLHTFSDPLEGGYMIDNMFVMLKGGIATQFSTNDEIETNMTETRVFGTPATGDLDGDGDMDQIFFAYQNSGGTGTFFYVVAAENVGGGKYTGTKAIFLGDRIAPQNINIIRGVAQVNYAVRKEDESMVAEPSVGVTKYVVIKGGELVEVK